MHVTCGHCRPCRTGQRHICENTRILGVHGDGCFAQYVVVPAFNVIPLDRHVVPPRVGAFLDALGNAVHTTQVADLSGKSVAVLGYGPIGAMCAEIARDLRRRADRDHRGQRAGRRARPALGELAAVSRTCRSSS